MEIKFLEIRDSMTFIPAFAVRLASRSEQEAFLCARAGFGTQPNGAYIFLTRLSDGETNHDPYNWTGNRTMRAVHLWLLDVAWDGIVSGDVVDVQYLMGEADTPKESERLCQTDS